MGQDKIRPECQILFSNLQKGQAIIERKLDRALENLSNMAVDVGATKQAVQNHYGEMLRSINNNKDEMLRTFGNNKQAISFNRKLSIFALCVAFAGGGVAGIVNWMV